VTAKSVSQATLPAVFVINLPRSLERREHVSAQLTAQGIPFSIHPAVDARELCEESVREMLGEVALRPQPFLGRRLTLGEIACGLSHLTLYRRLLREGIEAAVLLEDDVDLAPSFAAVLRGLVSAGRFEMVLLGHHSARHGYSVGAETSLARRALHPAHAVARVCEFAMGAYAYLVTRSALAKLARHAEPLRMPADWVTGYAPSAGVRQYAITPPCAVPSERFHAESEIGGREGGSAMPAPVRGIDPSLWRLGGKLFLAVRKLGFFPGSYSKRF